MKGTTTIAIRNIEDAIVAWHTHEKGGWDGSGPQVLVSPMNQLPRNSQICRGGFSFVWVRGKAQALRH
ncbi:hypothetical protein N8D56_01125 [Devosia sp. A8/3-2]|nr:hypothetical protein N8D56_01125 [Devosia sp. A8/3-2]